MKIALYGYTDKRPVLYSLMHLLKKMGNVVVFTPNRQLSRFLPDHSDEGMIGNVQVYVTDFSPDEVWEGVQRNQDDFDYIIYDVRDQLVEGVDVNIHVLGSEMEDGEADFLDGCVIDYYRIKLMYDKKPAKDKSYKSVKIDEGYLLKVERMERNSVLCSLQNKDLAIALASFLEEKSDKSAATMRKILMERGRF